jgi:hypothetical protein
MAQCREVPLNHTTGAVPVAFARGSPPDSSPAPAAARAPTLQSGSRSSKIPRRFAIVPSRMDPSRGMGFLHSRPASPLRCFLAEDGSEGWFWLPGRSKALFC